MPPNQTRQPLLHLYIDETGSRHLDRASVTPKHGNDWFAMGGVLINEEDVETARTQLDTFKREWPQIRGRPKRDCRGARSLHSAARELRQIGAQKNYLPLDSGGNFAAPSWATHPNNDASACSKRAVDVVAKSPLQHRTEEKPSPKRKRKALPKRG
jgi:hypothetical protein